MMEGVDVDVHSQSWYCIAHLMSYGLLKKIIKYAYYTLITHTRTRTIFQVRLRDFPWRGASPVTFVQDNFGSKMSMTNWRQCACASQFCFDGLIDDSMLQFIVQLVRWTAFVSRPMTKPEADEATVEARKFIKMGKILLEDEWAVPNTHGVYSAYMESQSTSL